MKGLTKTSELIGLLKGCTSLESMDQLQNGDVVFDFFNPILDKQEKGVQAIMHKEFFSVSDVNVLDSHIVDENDFFINELLSNTIQMELSIVNY